MKGNWIYLQLLLTYLLFPRVLRESFVRFKLLLIYAFIILHLNIALYFLVLANWHFEIFAFNFIFGLLLLIFILMQTSWLLHCFVLLFIFMNIDKWSNNTFQMCLFLLNLNYAVDLSGSLNNTILDNASWT